MKLKLILLFVYSASFGCSSQGSILDLPCEIKTQSIAKSAYASSMSCSHFPEMEDRVKSLIIQIYEKLLSPPTKNDKRSKKIYPGTLYDVGGYSIHLLCVGESKPGIPTILFESGIGSSGVTWLPLQRKLSTHARVCAYDRVGYGWSDEWPAHRDQPLQDVTPRPIDEQVETLDKLLTQAQLTGPMILVGHSYGGPIALAYETKYPNRISSLILLDPHEDGITKEDSLFTDKISDDLKSLKEMHSPEAKIKWVSQLAQIEQHVDQFQDKKHQAKILTEDLSALIQSLNPLKWHRILWSEWRALHSSCAKIKTHPSKTLSHKPLTVISSDPKHRKSEGQSYLHMELAKQSDQGKFYFALGSSHDIPGDRPDLTLKVILDHLNNKPVGKVILPRFKGQTRFFVDSKVARIVCGNDSIRRKQEKSDEFCRELGLGFETYAAFGSFNDPKTGIAGCYITCQ